LPGAAPRLSPRSRCGDGILVPFFAKWPARIAAGTQVTAPVHHFDLYATAAAAAGAPLPDDRNIDGVDLLPYVSGEANGVPHRALFWKSGAAQTALVDGWKLNPSDPPGRTWLFALGSDPSARLSDGSVPCLTRPAAIGRDRSPLRWRMRVSRSPQLLT